MAVLPRSLLLHCADIFALVYQIPLHFPSARWTMQKSKTKHICPAIPRPAEGLGPWSQMTGALH